MLYGPGCGQVVAAILDARASGRSKRKDAQCAAEQQYEAHECPLLRPGLAVIEISVRAASTNQTATLARALFADPKQCQVKCLMRRLPPFAQVEGEVIAQFGPNRNKAASSPVAEVGDADARATPLTVRFLSLQSTLVTGE